MIGLVRGTPLPSWVRAVHVHAVLVGGVAQLILAGFLLLLSPSPSNAQAESISNPITFWALNGGLIGMLTGFWLHQDLVVSIAGLAVIAGFLSAIHSIRVRARHTRNTSQAYSWYYALTIFGLVGGSACGLLLALGIIPESYGYLRLAHIHLVVLVFIVLSLMGMMRAILPMVWATLPSSPKLVRMGTIVLPIGMIVLIGGFLNSSVPIELIAGAMLMIGAGLLVADLFLTWLSSTHTGSAASDHLLISTFFLLLSIILGVLVGLNHVSSPPALPYGTLHLVAYTHMAFIGFIMNAIMGTTSYLLPLALATDRVESHKKRGIYLKQLTSMMNRGRSVRIASLSLGTMGLGILAAFTWNVPLNSAYVHTALWTSLALLLIGLVLFSIKVTSVLAKQPEPIAAHHEPPQEFKLTA